MALSKVQYNSDIYIDICTVGDLKLAVYPNYLLLGKPVFDSHHQRVKFNTLSSIKLSEPVFRNFFIFLQKAFQLFENEDNSLTVIYSESPISDNVEIKDLKNSLFYEAEGEKNLRIVILCSTYNETQVKFYLNFQTFNELCESFSCLFFKTYCYTAVQNTVIEHFVHLTIVKDIKQKSLKDLITLIKEQNVLELTHNEVLIIANLIVRHRKLISLWRHFAVLNPRYLSLIHI